MSERDPEAPDEVSDDVEAAGSAGGEYGSLSVEDAPLGTVDPADVAGTAQERDKPIGYSPEFSAADGSEDPE